MVRCSSVFPLLGRVSDHGGRERTFERLHASQSGSEGYLAAAGVDFRTTFSIMGRDFVRTQICRNILDTFMQTVKVCKS